MKFILLMTFFLFGEDYYVMMPQPKMYFTTYEACKVMLERKLRDNQGVGSCRKL